MRLNVLIKNIYWFDMFGLHLNEISRLKSKKSSPTKNPCSIYHSMRLDVLTKNMYGFDMFRLNFNELLVIKVPQNQKKKNKVFLNK